MTTYWMKSLMTSYSDPLSDSTRDKSVSRSDFLQLLKVGRLQSVCGGGGGGGGGGGAGVSFPV